MGIIQRYMDKTGCKPDEAIDRLRSKKAALAFNMTSMEQEWTKAESEPEPPKSAPISSQAILIRRKKQILCA
jgi:hypothetical protein